MKLSKQPKVSEAMRRMVEDIVFDFHSRDVVFPNETEWMMAVVNEVLSRQAPTIDKKIDAIRQMAAMERELVNEAARQSMILAKLQINAGLAATMEKMDAEYQALLEKQAELVMKGHALVAAFDEAMTATDEDLRARMALLTRELNKFREAIKPIETVSHLSNLGRVLHEAAKGGANDSMMDARRKTVALDEQRDSSLDNIRTLG